MLPASSRRIPERHPSHPDPIALSGSKCHIRIRMSDTAEELGAEEVVLPGPLLCMDRSICGISTPAQRCSLDT